VTFEVGHQIAFCWDQGKGWFSFWPHDPAIDADFLRALRLVIDMGTTRGIPALRAYFLDEAGAHNLLDEAVYYYGLIKKRMPEVATLTSIGGGMALGLCEIVPVP
jgi:hypothetical protein